MANTFQQFAAENLAAFGFAVTAEEIPEWDAARDTLNAITLWADSVDERTWEIIRWADLSEGLWRVKANIGGTFADTKRDISSAVERAHNQLDEQPSGLPDGTGVSDVVSDNP